MSSMKPGHSRVDNVAPGPRCLDVSYPRSPYDRVVGNLSSPEAADTQGHDLIPSH